MMMVVIVDAFVLQIMRFLKKKKMNLGEPKETSIPFLIIQTFIIGLIIGLVGAGGGFLIIPALLFFGNLPIKQAIGTSLLIIFINSLIGFGGDVLNGIEINYKLLFTISAIALIGMFIGTYLSKKIDGAKLTKYFETVTSADEVGVRKPNPKIFDFALKLANAEKEEQMYR